MSNEKKITISDEIDDKERAQLLAQTIPKELKNWMTNISDQLKDIPVWKLTIPGIYLKLMTLSLSVFIVSKHCQHLSITFLLPKRND